MIVFVELFSGSLNMASEFENSIWRRDIIKNLIENILKNTENKKKKKDYSAKAHRTFLFIFLIPSTWIISSHSTWIDSPLINQFL